MFLPINNADFQKVLTRTIILPVVLMLLLTGVLLWQLSYLFTVTQRVEQTDQVIVRMYLLLKRSIDMETGVRGYLLTGELDFLEPYEFGRKKIPPVVDELQLLLQENSTQRERLGIVRQDLDQVQAYNRRLIDLRQQGGNYQDITLQLVGKVQMDQLRENIGTMIIEEEALRDSRSQTAQQFVPAVVFLSIAIALALAGVLAYFTRKQLIELAQRYETAIAATFRQTEQLKASEARFRSLTDALPQIVWTAQPDGNLDYYNQRWFEYTGLTLAETQGSGWQPVLHPDDLQNCVDRWTHSVQTGTDYEVEYRFKRAGDGTYRWHLGRALPIHDSRGQIIKWIGTCTDTDDQKNCPDP
ncbi:CHASE3 domain-containing protein [Candidatus Cyanaurora vandensis]|uniref:CHASE3 domain-containing protein n=1 Tax=Candidatus Cyanaurora vandensis TaxID=2714958 RepID=UPI00258019CD|nr:CHASE3 domain-containing protein [Candidatus Cyanaurora vandensis]